uniref:Hexapeptide repeat-containing protein acetyltransferase n=1 Tax=Cyanothece sp. (strain PCC 7425 / ATCC 29141) TaxID=395961 RepID=B8HNB6_CYAP4
MGSFSYLGNAHIAHTSIGRFCSIAPYLFCGAGIHPTNFVSTSPVFYSILNQCGVSFSNKNHFEEHKETVIGHDVWIGNRVFIKDGIKIGHGAVLGAGTVVTKDVPDYAIVAGVPAKLIRFRFPEEAIEKLLKIQWWHWTEEKLRAAQPFFAQSDIDVFIKWAFDSAEIGKEVSL